MNFELGSNGSIPGTPSIKRQKTSCGYNTTSVSWGEKSPRIIPETPEDFKSKPIHIIDIDDSSLPRALTRTEPLSRKHVQVPASSPLTASNSPGKEIARESKISPTKKINSTHGIENSSLIHKRSLSESTDPDDMLKKSDHDMHNKSLSSKAISSNNIFSDGNNNQPIQLGSSDDEIETTDPDIHPVRFTQSGTKSKLESTSKSVAPKARFQSIIQSAVYQSNPTNSRKSDSAEYSSASLARNNLSSQGNGNRYKISPQVRMERAQPISDISVHDIHDDSMEVDIKRLRSIFPSLSVLAAKEALVASSGSFEQAANLIADTKLSVSPPNFKKGTTISLIHSDDSDEFSDSDGQKLINDPEPQMKRTLKVPTQSIINRYSSTQISHSKSSINSHFNHPAKHKRRLVQGRKNLISPGTSRHSSPRRSPVPLEFDSLSETDSGNESGVIDEDRGLESRVLKYLNTCEVSDLVELANISREMAEIMLAARPFKSIHAARTVENEKKLKSGKKSSRAPIGDKIIDTTMEMFRGYEAIDTLVKKCNELSKPLTAEISQWGFNVYGAQKKGELEMTCLDEVEAQLESNLGPQESHTNSAEVDDEDGVVTRKRSHVQFLKKPNIMAEDCVLKDYQVVGMNWLALMSRNGLSGILADEMGLGKTCQVISFLAHLVETGNSGPHLVVCPGSTLENWLREIHRFAPKLRFEPYHGPQKERQMMADEILQQRNRINVVVTTYDMAAKKEDSKFMRRLKPDVCVYDEGHMLKNVKSQRYQGLIRIPARFRLLLTGTPLQNNLQELAALLAFILPDVFKELEEDLNTIFKAKATTSDSDHAALLSTQRIDRARSILTPFVLRRKKSQVLKHLPAKHCRTEYCSLHKAQKEIYNGHLEQARERARNRLQGNKVPKTDEKNPLMQLRKAAIHPLLFRRHFDDAKVEKMADILRKKEPTNFPSHLKREHLIAEMHSGSDFWLHQWCRDYPCISKFDIPDLAWMDSGKVETMIKLVKKYKDNGDRVLLFSQFSLVLDIIEAVFNTSRIHYTRIDGSTKIEERQSLIDTFRDDESITVFLLTTKAGGTGINLMYANKVIIFDGSFNPQDDKQAENRAHRVGQIREVEVVRLVTRGTVEEQILALGDSKLQLDGRVAGDDDAAKAEAAGEKAVARMLLDGTGNDCPSNDEKTEEKKENDHNKEQKSLASIKKKTIIRMVTQNKKKSEIIELE